MNETVWRIGGWKDTDRENRGTWPKPCDSTVFVYQKPKRFDLRMKPDLPSNRPISDCLLSNDTARP
jgi:hypothetical protein